MTHDELLARIDDEMVDLNKTWSALRAVVELHKPMTGVNYRSNTPQCSYCRSLCHSNSGLNCEDDGDGLWPCGTILRIEKELG